MRVLVLSHMYPRTHYPGGGIFVHEQVDALRRGGIDARVLSGDPFWILTLKPKLVLGALRAYQRETSQWSAWNDVPVMFFPYLCGHFFRPTMHALTYAHGLRRVLAQVRQDFPFDVVHAHTSFLDGTAALSAARLAKKPFLITEHTGPFSILTRNAFMRWTTRRAVEAADLVLAVSGSLRDDMRRHLALPEQPIDVLTNGVDIETFNPGSALPRRCRSGKIRALWIGHFSPIKRVDRLVDAFSAVAARIPQLELTFLGHGDEGKAEVVATLEQRGLLGRAQFLPPRDRPGVCATMREHDFLVISSEKETFGLVALEALAAGVPVLSTACGGPQETVSDASLGVIVSNDTQGLTEGLLTMVERLKSYDPAHLHEHARSLFSWNAVAARLSDIYADLVSKSRPW